MASRKKGVHVLSDPDARNGAFLLKPSDEPNCMAVSRMIFVLIFCIAIGILDQIDLK